MTSITEYPANEAEAFVKRITAREVTDLSAQLNSLLEAVNQLLNNEEFKEIRSSYSIPAEAAIPMLEYMFLSLGVDSEDKFDSFLTDPADKNSGVDKTKIRDYGNFIKNSLISIISKVTSHPLFVLLSRDRAAYDLLLCNYAGYGPITPSAVTPATMSVHPSSESKDDKAVKALANGKAKINHKLVINESGSEFNDSLITVLQLATGLPISTLEKALEYDTDPREIASVKASLVVEKYSTSFYDKLSTLLHQLLLTPGVVDEKLIALAKGTMDQGDRCNGFLFLHTLLQFHRTGGKPTSVMDGEGLHGIASRLNEIDVEELMAKFKGGDSSSLVQVFIDRFRIIRDDLMTAFRRAGYSDKFEDTHWEQMIIVKLLDAIKKSGLRSVPRSISSALERGSISLNFKSVCMALHVEVKDLSLVEWDLEDKSAKLFQGNSVETLMALLSQANHGGENQKLLPAKAETRACRGCNVVGHLIANCPKSNNATSGATVRGPMVDITIECVDCKTQVRFDAGEQAFYAAKGFSLSNKKRCKKCSVENKAKRNAMAPTPGISTPSTAEGAKATEGAKADI